MKDCIFCKIIRGEIPSYKVYEDGLVYAFLDIAPATKGHTVIIPKKHVRNTLEISPEDMALYSYAIPIVSNILMEKLNPIGMTILNNNLKPDQVVDHLHFHLIPRYENDGLFLDKFIINQEVNYNLKDVFDLLQN